VRRVVADTHALVFQLTDPSRLGKAARRAFAAVDAGRWRCDVPVICLIEIALLYERGRVRVSPDQVAAALDEHPAYGLAPLDAAQCLEFAPLVGVHDPMDRLVLAATRALGAALLSADEVFDGRGIERIWD
jgi:PIN domain nuclease of toxin-antitoxin system